MSNGRRLRSVLAAGAVAILAAVCIPGPTASATPVQAPVQAPAPVPPAEDPFYKPPSPLPAGQAGDIIRSRGSQFTLDPVARTPYAGASAWQVLYLSQNATGSAIAVSGTVLVPVKAWSGPGSRPLVSYAVGTHGLGDQCAPSYALTLGLDYESLFISDALTRGFAVAVTDMEGLGTPGNHTYMVGRSQGRAVLDMARAAQRLPGSGLSSANPVGVMGYSQGGASAGWAAELAPTYAPELPLKGVVAGGVPADLTAVAQGLDGGLFVALALMAGIGLDSAYPELRLDGYLNDAGRRLLATSKDVCVVSPDGLGTVFGSAFKRMTDYASPNPLTTPAWQARLKENRLGSTRPGVPVFQPHAVLDEIVPYGQADTLHKDWCKLGTNLTWRPYPLAEHVLGLVQSSGTSFGFLADRFAGRPVQGNC